MEGALLIFEMGCHVKLRKHTSRNSRIVNVNEVCDNRRVEDVCGQTECGDCRVPGR